MSAPFGRPIDRSVGLGEGPGVFLEHLGLLIGSVLVLEAEEGSASSEIHLLDLVSGLGSTESHEGVDIHVVSSGQEGEEVVVSEGVHEIPVPLVVASEDLGESLGQRGFDLDLLGISDVSEVGNG